MPDLEPDIITDAGRLDGLCARLREAGWFAFDTEFVGEDQYRPEVCLIQACTSDYCGLIDPLCGFSVTPFWELVADAGLLKLVHSGGEDLAQCPRETGRPAAGVVDLQIAAGLVGLGYPVSLSRLARGVLNTAIHKSQTLTDWRRRPLSAEQLRYAVEDVQHLRAMYDKMLARIRKLNREAWLREECDALCRVTGTPDLALARLKRLKGAGALEGRELAIAHALIDFRDELAKKYNRPARTILKDHIIVELAKRGWTDLKRVQTLRGLNLAVTAQKQMVAIIEDAKKSPPDTWPVLESEEDSEQEEIIIALLTAVLRDYCDANELAYALVGKRQHLRNLVRRHTRPSEPPRPHALETGWRRAIVGDLLEGVVQGRRGLRVARRNGKLGLVVE